MQLFKKYLLIVCCVFVAVATQAQQEFTKIITSANTPILGMTYVPTNSCGSTAAYYGVSGNKFGRTELDGTVSWVKQYYSADLGLTNFMRLSNGDFLLIGVDNANQSGGFQIYVTRVDCIGNQLWAKRYASQSGAYRSFMSGIPCPSTTGSAAFIAHGWYWGHDDIYFVKIDEQGNVLWSNSHYAGDTQIMGATSDGAGGASFVFEDSSMGWQSSFGHINANGVIDITKHYNTDVNTMHLGSIAKVTGGYLVGADNGLGGGDQLKVIKMDNNGNIMWIKDFPHIAGNVLMYDTGFGFQEDNQGNYYGHIWRSDEQKILKMTNNGTAIWYKRFDYAGEGYIPELNKLAFGGTTTIGGVSYPFYAIKNTNLDGLCFGNTLPIPTLPTESILSATDWTLTTVAFGVDAINANGQLPDAGAYATADICTVGVVTNEEALAQAPTVLPNPTNGNISIALNRLSAEEVSISIINLQGAVLETQKTFDGTTSLDIDLSAYPSGLYMVTMLTANGERVTQKVVKE